MDELDRRIVNALQEGFPLSHAPFAECAAKLDIGEGELIERLKALRANNIVTRFGPFYNAKEMGGGLCLCAMRVPDEMWESVCGFVNGLDEVAHNYRRDHELNMWFVLAVEKEDEIARVARKIETETGLQVHLFPKLKEYFLDMRVAA